MRRRLPAIAIFLLAGAVVNVGVAWGCAAWLPFDIWGSGIYQTFPGKSRQGTAWEVRPEARPKDKYKTFVDRFVENDAAASFSSDKTVPAWGFGVFQKPGYRGVVTFLEASQPSLDFDARKYGSKIGTPIPSAWLAEITERSRDPEIWTRFDASGWPMRSLWCGVSIYNDYLNKQRKREPSYFGGMPLQPFARKAKWPPWSPPHALPLRPIWSGFTINTLFYGAVLWPLIIGPLALRRLIRRRRGLCPKCAYPMGESAVCTECGQDLTKRVTVKLALPMTVKSARWLLVIGVSLLIVGVCVAHLKPKGGLTIEVTDWTVIVALCGGGVACIVAALLRSDSEPLFRWPA